MWILEVMVGDGAEHHQQEDIGYLYMVPVVTQGLISRGH